MDRPEPGLIKWSTNAARDTFLHINLQHRELRLYEPTGAARPGRFSCSRLAQHDDFPPLTTYDWSPAGGAGLVAVGTAAGVVNLLRIDDGANAYLELPLKMARTCQAVAFSTGGLLAVGLDRVRSDQCLHVWDVGRLETAVAARRTTGFPAVESGALAEPAVRLEPSVSVSSIRFFEDSPRTLVVGIKAQGLRIHDLRDPGVAMSFQTRCNNNLAIDYADPNYFASSALDQPGVLVWDRRATSRPVASPGYLDAVDADDGMPWGGALRLDHAMRTDAADAAPGDSKHSFIRSLRFCRGQPGLLAVLSRTGQLRAFSTKREYVRPDMRAEGGPELLEVRRSNEMDPLYAEAGRRNDRIVSFDWITLNSPLLRPRVLVLRASGAFDVLEKPSFTSDALFKMIPWQSPFRGLEEGTSYHTPMEFEPSHAPALLGPLLVEQALSDVALFGPDKVDVNSVARKALSKTNIEALDLALGGEATDDIYRASSIADKMKALRRHDHDVSDSLASLGTKSSGKREETRLKDLSSQRHRHENLLYSAMSQEGVPPNAQAILDHVMLLRAKEKYLFDFAVNQRVVSDDPWLQSVWAWVAGAEEAADEGGMMSSPLDLSYLGVYAVWTNDLGSKPAARLADLAHSPDDNGWESCLDAIGKKRHVPQFSGAETKRPQHRRICLDICSWGSDSAVDLGAASLQSLDTADGASSSSLHTKAAAQALFRGDLKEAVRVLKKASTAHPELLFVALAIQLMGKGADHAELTDQLDFDERVASRTDPYLRAISSLIATGDWAAIANQRSLPLQDRAFVAVRHFSDDELTAWLEHEVTQAVEAGDISAVVLTGIADRLVDVLARYVQRFMDYQTATLLLSVCAPRYVDDVRSTALRNAYRAYLQRHRAFFERCKFEVESTKRSKHRGVPTIRPAARQIALRCVYCDAETTLIEELHQHPALTSTAATATTAVGTAASDPLQPANPFTDKMVRAGVSCPNCKRHLPRCVVCLEVVGMPRSDRPELAADRDARLAARFPTFCLRCEHVLHLDHARQWFARHQECPVPECRCRCNVRPNPELAYR